VLVGLTAANAKAGVVTWLILTVGVVFAEIDGRGWLCFLFESAVTWDKGNRFRWESKPIRILELH
jgi:hypothetical protein